MSGRKQAPSMDLILAGELIGKSYNINAEALAEYLETAPSDFFYKRQTQAVIDFCKAVNPKYTTGGQN